jgi:hypothetical protein
VFGIFKETLVLTLLAVLPATVLMIAYHWSHAASPPAVMIAILRAPAVGISGCSCSDHPLGQELRVAWQEDRPVVPPPRMGGI